MVTEKQPVTYIRHPLFEGMVWIQGFLWFDQSGSNWIYLKGLNPDPCQTAKSVRLNIELPSTYATHLAILPQVAFFGMVSCDVTLFNGCELSDLQGLWMKFGHFQQKNHWNHLVDVNKNSCWKTAGDQKYPEHFPPSAVFERHAFLVFLPRLVFLQIFHGHGTGETPKAQLSWSLSIPQQF